MCYFYCRKIKIGVFLLAIRCLLHLLVRHLGSLEDDVRERLLLPLTVHDVEEAVRLHLQANDSALKLQWILYSSMGCMEWKSYIVKISVIYDFHSTLLMNSHKNSQVTFYQFLLNLSKLFRVEIFLTVSSLTFWLFYSDSPELNCQIGKSLMLVFVRTE